MSNVDLQQLIQALDAETRRDLERSAERCVARGGSKILVEDLLLGLLERPLGLLSRALQDAEVDAGELSAALQSRVENSASRNPVFAPELLQWLQDGLLVANLELGQTQVEQAALILALLRNPVRYAGSRYQPLLAKLNIERLKEFALSQQEKTNTAKAAAPRESLLERFTHNLTQQARDGRLDPVLCRDGAIRQMVDILARRRKNNPIVVGEAGVGKTAIVEGLASRIAAGEVPQVLKGVELLSLDMGLLQAGAGVKGEFENRLRGVIDEVKASPKPIILLIDEAHQMIGAGGAAGQGDEANLLKPALASGEIRTIAATTWAEYKKYFEKDAAITRRFQVVKVEEPGEDVACAMLRAMAPLMERHFNIRIRDEAVTAAVRLSHRYITGRQLPDKAISVLDTACARVALGQSAAPAALEAAEKSIEHVAAEIAALERDDDGPRHAARLKILRASHGVHRQEHAAHKERWRREQAIVADIGRRRAALENGAGDTPEIRAQIEELAAVQGESAMVPIEVDAQIVAAIVSGWTGIPLGKMVKDDIRTVLNLGDALQQRILGQPHAIEAVVQRVAPRAPNSTIRTSRPACSCSSARPASARPKRRWRWPSCCMAASANSSPST